MTDEQEKPKRQRRNRNPCATTRLNSEQLRAMGQIFPGFDTWYRSTHGPDGKMLPDAEMPGLMPRHYGEQQEG